MARQQKNSTILMVRIEVTNSFFVLPMTTAVTKYFTSGGQNVHFEPICLLRKPWLARKCAFPPIISLQYNDRPTLHTEKSPIYYFLGATNSRNPFTAVIFFRLVKNSLLMSGNRTSLFFYTLQNVSPHFGWLKKLYTLCSICLRVFHRNESWLSEPSWTLSISIECKIF